MSNATPFPVKLGYGPPRLALPRPASPRFPSAGERQQVTAELQGLLLQPLKAKSTHLAKGKFVFRSCCHNTSTHLQTSGRVGDMKAGLGGSGRGSISAP